VVTTKLATRPRPLSHDEQATAVVVEATALLTSRGDDTLRRDTPKSDLASEHWNDNLPVVEPCDEPALCRAPCQGHG
jgi:hypothetical protein